MTSLRQLIDAARSLNATITESHGATIIVLAKPAIAERLSVADVAKLAACTERRVRDAAREGELVGCELSERALSFAREDVIAWLEKHPIKVRAPRNVDEAEIDRRMSGRAGAR